MNTISHFFGRVLTAVIASLVILLATSVDAADSDCGGGLIASSSKLFKRGLNLKKINNVMSDQYGAAEIDVFLERSVNVANNAPLNQQARPRQAIMSALNITADLDQMSKRLLAVWPHSKPVFEIYLTSWRFYSPFTTLDGHILVPIGFLMRAEFDDEVAFIMAHEISHLLLGHQVQLAEREAQKNSMQDLSDSATAGSALLQTALRTTQVMNPGSSLAYGEIIQRSLEYFERFSDFTREYVHPLWQSKQEDEADLLALELLMLAGYSPDGVAEALRNLRTSEESFCAATRVFTKNLETFMKEDVETYWQLATLADTSDVVSLAWKKTRNFSEKKLRKMIVQQALPKTHRPYDKRLTYIWKYAFMPGMETLTEESEDRDMTTVTITSIRSAIEWTVLVDAAKAIALTNNALLKGDLQSAGEHIGQVNINSQESSMLKYRYYLAQDDEKTAIENVKFAMNAEYPSRKALERNFFHLLDGEQWQAATLGTETARDLYRDPLYFLPEQVYISASQPRDHEDDTQSLLNACERAQDKNLEGQCQAAALGMRADFRDRYPEILASANCSEAAASPNDVICQQPGENKTLKRIKKILKRD
jgi:hypothetical protein